ncbi:thioesterase family protein [uncultured Psychroserpens sp.]|uniref:acyl-CoA thioesterase n=1 Tax=uncultured Psychroserpens sp. TaxID=255436 RepID=UPI0026128AC9|nr:acyl-CoA thioesterase [uncultured Psychroserpens sp.]
MQIFEKQIIVSSKDLDERKHVNNVRYVQWVQDIAEQHWNIEASANLLNTYYWVMISHHIHYKGEALLGDELLLKTFVTLSDGVKSTRIVEVYNYNSNKLLTTSETIWCLMAVETNRPTRIIPEIKTLFS